MECDIKCSECGIESVVHHDQKHQPDHCPFCGEEWVELEECEGCGYECEADSLGVCSHCGAGVCESCDQGDCCDQCWEDYEAQQEEENE